MRYSQDAVKERLSLAAGVIRCGDTLHRPPESFPPAAPSVPPGSLEAPVGRGRCHEALLFQTGFIQNTAAIFTWTSSYCEVVSGSIVLRTPLETCLSAYQTEED